MFYTSEEKFIDGFLASLRKIGVLDFPFDTPEFFSGIENMQNYFNQNKDNFSDQADELSMLFIKDTFQGVYKRFRNIISAQNGIYVSFVNPDYVIGTLKISEQDANRILKEEITLPEHYLSGFAKKFCEGANISISS